MPLIKARLDCTEENEKFIEELTPVYLIACWARYGVREYPFSGEFKKHPSGELEPLVYDFVDHNGTFEEYILRPISDTTTGFVLDWSFSKEVAKDIAEKYNAFNENTSTKGETECQKN